MTNKINVAVIGTGTMGVGIAQLFAQNGYQTTLKSRETSSLDKARIKLESTLSKYFDEEKKIEIINNIKFTTDFQDLNNAKLIIECCPEDIKTKEDVLKKISHFDAIIATNTSSLSLNEMSGFLSKPEKFIGMHFFNPAPKMTLVEIVYLENTDKDMIEFVKNISLDLGKTPILVKDSPGFIVNRTLMQLINEAASELDQGIATAQDIDNAIKTGLNHPMGPLALADFIGLDICLEIMKNLHKGLNNEKYKPCKIFYEMTSKGMLGKKTGKGFYEYGDKK
jgi:3-hydroxybutyryl-CoA dehydrogenase